MTIRSRRHSFRIALVAGLLASLLVIVVLAAAGDLMEAPNGLWSATGLAIKRFGYLGGFLLIYLEESGIPLLIPGDVFLVYVGHRLPSNLWAWIAAWSGFVVAVVLGSMNLYLLSRRLGRRALTHPLARFLHVTPERLAEAERHFRRWGPWTIIVGRHIPGLRVPITVAAGVLGLDFRMFMISVTVSSAIWAAIFLTVGIVYGESAVRFLHAPMAYTLLPAVLCAVGVWALRRHLARQMVRVTAWVIAIWRPRRPAATRGNELLVIACALSLVGAFAAEYLTETAYVGVGGVIPVVTASWLLSGRAAAGVTAWASALTAMLYLIGSLDLATMVVAVAGLLAVGTMVGLASGLARTRSEGRDLKQDLEDHDRRLRSLQALTSEWINTFSHELRTPLGVLRGYVSMLEDGTIDRERSSAVVSTLSHKLEEINVLIEGGLIDYAERAVDAIRPRDIARGGRDSAGLPP